MKIMKSLFIYAPTLRSMEHWWKYYSKEGKKKCIHKAPLDLWQLFFQNAQSLTSPFLKDLFIFGIV